MSYNYYVYSSAPYSSSASSRDSYSSSASQHYWQQQPQAAQYAHYYGDYAAHPSSYPPAHAPPPPPGAYPSSHSYTSAQDFRYIAPDGSNTHKVCEFFATPRGCIKSTVCNYLHITAAELHSLPPDITQSLILPIIKQPSLSAATRNRVCEFFSSPRGCVKGNSCDFIHPDSTYSSSSYSNGAPQAAPAKSARICGFLSTPRGCIKGAACSKEDRH